MVETQYKEQRYKRMKQWYRVKLGADLFIQFPLLNVVWILLIVGDVFLYGWKNKLVAGFNFPYFIEPFLNGCLGSIVIILPIVCVIGIMEGIGELRARGDEADIENAFHNLSVRDKKIILVKKRRLKKNGGTVREFCTTIQMEEWNKNKEALADQLNVSFVEEFEYGGKGNRNGRRIVMKSIDGRKPTSKGILYDETF